MLAAIATAHPHIISVLLERLRETIEKVGMVSDVQRLSNPAKSKVDLKIIVTVTSLFMTVIKHKSEFNETNYS